MIKIGLILVFFILLQTNAFNAAPYEMNNHASNENSTWTDLNKTVKSFNRSNMILSEFSNLKNTTWSLFDIDFDENNENFTRLGLFNATNNSSNILNQNENLKDNSTIELPVLINSPIELKELNASNVSPLVEIMDPIPENQTLDFNSTFIDGTIEFDQILIGNFDDLISPIENLTKFNNLTEFNGEQTASVDANITGEFFPVFSSLVMNESNLFELNTFIDLVAIDSSNENSLSSEIYALQASIKHSIIKYINPKIGRFCVKLEFDSNIDQVSNIQEVLPLNLTVRVKSPIIITQSQFRNALVEFSANTKRCVLQNQTEIRCSLFRAKDSNSLLRISDYWIELDEFVPTQEKLTGNEYEIFTYKPVWIVGLAIIGGIIAIFFFGCIVAICYTRRPYKRCGKVYEVDSATRKNNQPFIPGVHPATKASAITKTKEMYYQ